MPKRSYPNSYSNPRPKRPDKPYSDFPLFAHATGRWAKKIRGRFVYFGPWSDSDGALQRYLEQRDDLHAGRSLPIDPEALTLREMVNRFLTAKQRKAEAGEIRGKTFSEYHQVATEAITAFGARRPVAELQADDFADLRAQYVKRMGPLALAKRVQFVRSIFKWAYESALLDKPMRFGPDFVRPTKKAMRRARNNGKARMFEAPEVRALLDTANCPMRAIILLGVNVGMGNTDVADLPIPALDLNCATVSHPRPKTAVPRRGALWPETVDALHEAIRRRPAPKNPDDAELVFVTKYGQRWVRQREHDERRHVVVIDSVGLEFGKIMKTANVKMPGRGFYGLRRSFRTVADEVADTAAVNFVMGHEADDMATHYRERISDDRLRSVSEHVHTWLFNTTE